MGAYILNLDDNESIGTYRRALYVDAKNVKRFDSFGVEHVPKEIRKFIRKKDIIKIFIKYKHLIE